jgi:hypothetical protein
VDSAELLAATKSTGHLVFDPRCLCGDKPLACFYRTEGMILLQALDFDYRLVKTLRKFCINSTNIDPEHPVPPELFSNVDGGHPLERLPSEYAGVVALRQVD